MYILLVLAGLGLCLLLSMLLRKRDDSSLAGPTASMKATSLGKASITCPLCSSRLSLGEKIVSTIYKDKASSQSSICHIKGCPHCYPIAESAKIKRCCPVCSKPLGASSYLIGRVFTKTKDAKAHLIVTGCIYCSNSAKC